jgi:hypothetical protein
MRLSKLTGMVTAVTVFCSQVSFSQNSQNFHSVSLNNLDAFRDPGKNWVIASDAVADFTKVHDIKPVKGEGAVVNLITKNDKMNLFTKDEFGDLDLELDFMMAKNSNSGIYLQGRYEVQLFDSWTKLNPASTDLGGIYLRYTPQRGTFEGIAPLMNVAKAPGLWQHMAIKFRAPKFNDKGQKIANARFEEVMLNGVVIQQNAEVTGPTGYDVLGDEQPKGPIMIQGDHGPVAFKNIRYSELAEDTAVTVNKESEDWSQVSPIDVNATGKPSFIKTFLNYGNKKLTHVLSVGNPSQANYSYDVKQGALFQVWRGEFMDLTHAWFQRGEEQLGIPLGSVTVLSDAPAVAILADEQTAWPDSLAFDEMQNKGYTLDKQRSPTFSYSVKGLEVKDSIVCQPAGEFLSRTISINNAPSNVYCRIAEGSNIEKISDDIYAVNGKSYYIRADKKFQPFIRKSLKGQEMLVRYGNAGPVTYSIIW